MDEQSQVDRLANELAGEWVQRAEKAEAEVTVWKTRLVEETARLRDINRGAVDLVEQARGCVTAALNCTAHPWHGDDRARKWLMDADRLGGR